MVIDDEPIARAGLEKYIREVDFLTLRNSYSSALRAMEDLVERPIDLLFLDIEMPRMKGTDFLRTLQYSPGVIFTTAYSQYALESFDFNVIDYLVKPISFHRFSQAVDKVFHFLQADVEVGEAEPYVFIKDGSRMVKIFWVDIVLVEAAQNYVKIITEQGIYMVLMPLKRFLEQSEGRGLLRVSRSSVVNCTKITAIDGNQINLGSHVVKISRRMKENVIKCLTKLNLLD